MDPNIPDYLYGFTVFASSVLLLSVLCLIWFGVMRVPASDRERIVTASILSVTLLAWFAIAEFLGQRNVYWPGNTPTIPTIQFGLLVPLAIGLFLLLRAPSIARLVDAVPLSWLVGVQYYRALGIIFLLLWWGGFLPWQFALPAGIGDIATGILALVVAAMLVNKVRNAESAAYAWCLFGIADLVVATATGALTTPGRIHLVSLDAPNVLVTSYPLVMIPTFAVPVSIILHTMCLWKLKRLQTNALATQTAGV